jgi:hypothetical protein
MAVPAEVRPVAPSGEQNAPAWTTPAGGAVVLVGAVVRVAVVRVARVVGALTCGVVVLAGAR